MVLEILSISLSRNKRLIFEDFNLKLKKSQIMILIGDNGTGKTSLLDLVAGVIKPESGSIKINNLFLSQVGSNKRKFFTYLPHKDSLKDNLTIEENIMNWTNISGNKFEDQNFCKLLKYFNLLEIKDVLVSNLSQGQRKKVSLTKLLFSTNSLWLLDEPFNGLDKTSIRKTIRLIISHCKNGGSILLANHINLRIKNAKKIFLNRLKKISKKEKLDFDSWEKI
jgi:heme exporter protein A